MSDSPTTYNAFELWMVRSNLASIDAGEPAADVIATLNANGYYRIAAAVAEIVEERAL